MSLKQRLSERIETWRPRTARLLKEHGNVKIDEVTIGQAIGGARSVKCLVTDISSLDPEQGIRYRGFTVPEVFARLPKPPGREMPYVEGLFYLLLTGDLPSAADAEEVAAELRQRAPVPRYVFDVLRAMPRDVHPMTMLSTAVLVMQRESQFARRYEQGLSKGEQWVPTYEDALNLLAKLPEIGATIFRMKYRGDVVIPRDPQLDWGGGFAQMMGIGRPYDDVSRMYFILHSDHESGNVSSHAGHLVASSLADVYFSTSAMLDGLAGPLHGLANQEVLRFMQGIMARTGNRVPSEEELTKIVWETLEAGQVVPGFGHAVLRKTDPRYTQERNFCLNHLPDDPLFKCADLMLRVVPPILEKHGKAKNPWPNVDAQSGVIQWHYGVREYDFYTVLFGIGRALGVLANIIWDRALGYPIERPKSLTTAELEALAAKSAATR